MKARLPCNVVYLCAIRPTMLIVHGTKTLGQASILILPRKTAITREMRDIGRKTAVAMKGGIQLLNSLT